MRAGSERGGRRIRLLAAVGLLAGCAMTQTIVDKMQVEPLSPTPFHQQLDTKQQCMHCHTELAAAPAVPHPDYKNCAACHVAQP